jgi:DNA-binding transcriptional ArsR family regulator
LEALAQGEIPATVIADRFDLTQPAISKHLRVLREAGLVRVRTSGRFRYYALEPHKLQPMHDWLAHFEEFWVERLDRLGAHLRRKRKER